MAPPKLPLKALINRMLIMALVLRPCGLAAKGTSHGEAEGIRRLNPFSSDSPSLTKHEKATDNKTEESDYAWLTIPLGTKLYLVRDVQLSKGTTSLVFRNNTGQCTVEYGVHDADRVVKPSIEPIVAQSVAYDFEEQKGVLVVSGTLDGHTFYAFNCDSYGSGRQEMTFGDFKNLIKGVFRVVIDPPPPPVPVRP